MQITLQLEGPITAATGSLAFAVFSASKRAELAPLGLSEAQLDPLVQMQWRGRALTYTAQYPGAEEWTVCLTDGTPIGHYLLHKSEPCWRLVDLALLAAWRGQGIGTDVVRRLIAQASAEWAVLRLRVEKENPALHLYQRSGFRVTSSDELSFEMECRPQATALAKPQPAPQRQEHFPLSDGSLLDRAVVVNRIVSFLREIGLEISFGPIPSRSFLPGIHMVRNGLRVDDDALLYPGDLLHEAGHLALMPASQRCDDFPHSTDQAQEIAAIAWSYAAAVHLDLPPEIVFHDHGYRGQAKMLAHGFATGNCPGLPILWWLGLTTQPLSGSPSIYPKMLRWLRAEQPRGLDKTMPAPAPLESVPPPIGLTQPKYNQDFSHQDAESKDFTSTTTPKSVPKVAVSRTLAKTSGEGQRPRFAAALTLLLCIAASVTAHAQGILTVTPGRSIVTTAGTGMVGYSGDGGAATSATLATPSAIAYDATGNLYIADENNDVIREVSKSTGTITTVAGTGIAGFSGDGGPATSAQLDTPTGIAVDASGNLYIADSHNQRIREVSGGTITTIAGNGTPGFSGDAGSATAAELGLPSAVAVDAAGNVYIADTDNQRIRKLRGGTITTIAGTAEQGYTGDGSAATAATLDSPTGVAVDAAGNVYIADRHNQRIREIAAATGTITTLAGSGTPAFGGSYGGDGASATAAALANPTGVAVDAAGNVFIADSNNQRIRQVSSGAIATAAGTGEQGFSGDGGPATGAILDTPKSATSDASGNLVLADTRNQRVRSSAQPVIAFVSGTVGVASAAQPVTLANTGTAPISISSVSFIGAFGTATGGTCTATPITLAPGASCVENIAYVPTSAGAASGSAVFAGSGVVSQTVLLTGTSVAASTTTKLATSAAAPFVNQAITFTATVTAIGSGTPTGMVTFYANGVAIVAPQALVNGSASITTTFTTAGTYSITAVYSGDNNYSGSSTTAIAQLVGDFNFTIIPQPSNPGGSINQTVEPGQSATFDFAIEPLNDPFIFPITMSATGLPPGATVTFNPSTITLGASSASFTMTVHTVPTLAMLQRLNGYTGTTLAAMFLLLPFARRSRRTGRQMRTLLLIFVGFGGFVTLGSLTGCGSGSGFFGQPPQSYTINVIGTATDTQGATLQHITTVNLTVQ